MVSLIKLCFTISFSMQIGGLPAHATATGKILLAALEPAEVARRLGGRLLERVTERPNAEPRRRAAARAGAPHSRTPAGQKEVVG